MDNLSVLSTHYRPVFNPILPQLLHSSVVHRDHMSQRALFIGSTHTMLYPIRTTVVERQRLDSKSPLKVTIHGEYMGACIHMNKMCV